MCRQHALEIVFNNRRRIGGRKIIVEIDEAYFGKPKYNRGRRKKGQWYFGALERHNKKSCVFFPIENRGRECLSALIKR